MPYKWPTAAKLLQSCPTLCDPIDNSPPGSPVPGILQARTLEWVAISFSNAWKWKVKVKSLSRVRLLATPWTAAYQAPLSMGFSRQEYWSGVPLPSPSDPLWSSKSPWPSEGGHASPHIWHSAPKFNNKIRPTSSCSSPIPVIILYGQSCAILLVILSPLYISLRIFLGNSWLIYWTSHSNRKYCEERSGVLSIILWSALETCLSKYW